MADRERVEITFGKSDIDKELFEHLTKKGMVIGRTAYLKQLLYEDMLRDKEKSSSK